MLRGLAAHLGYDLQLLAGAFSDDDAPDGEVSFQEQERERRHAELMRRYGQPVSLGVREYREAARRGRAAGRARGLREGGGRSELALTDHRKEVP